MKSVKFSGELQSKSSCTSDSKMEIFPWLSNIYRWRIYLWNVSYALRKTARLKHIKQCISGTGNLSVRASDRDNASHFKLKTIGYYLMRFFKALHIKLDTFRTNCIMHLLHSSSVCFFPRYVFRCAHIKLLYINIKGIASYRIAYREYIYISYKLNISPSPRYQSTKNHLNIFVQLFSQELC